MKKLLTLLFAILLVFTFSMKVDAKNDKDAPESPLIIEEEITVTSKGGTFKVGFALIKFEKGFLADEDLPITFTVSIYAEDGEVYIEFSPDIEDFLRDVEVRANKYKGYIYDISLGENIYVEIQKQEFEAEHFSRYCWAT